MKLCFLSLYFRKKRWSKCIKRWCPIQEKGYFCKMLYDVWSPIFWEAGQQWEGGGPALDLCPSAGSWSAVRVRRTSAGPLPSCRKLVSSESQEEGPALDLCPPAGSWSAVRVRRTSAGPVLLCGRFSSEREEVQRWISLYPSAGCWSAVRGRRSSAGPVLLCGRFSSEMGRSSTGPLLIFTPCLWPSYSMDDIATWTYLSVRCIHFLKSQNLG